MTGGAELARSRSMDIERIDPREARAHLASDPSALFVCAYDDERWLQHQLDGAISLPELRAIEARLPRDTEIIFYCA